MTKAIVTNYTAAQVALIAAAHVAKGAPLDMSDAETLAANPAMNDSDGNPRKARSIVAKITREGIPYAKKVNVRKDGTKIETKAELVEQIAKAAGVTFENLTNAARGDLVKLRDFAVGE